jgi:hypothetical protein
LWPHLLQNFASSSSSTPHASHLMVTGETPDGRGERAR